MSYTVKQLAKLSGVSSRTLRFYDQIGLLKPGWYGENNYRYYCDEQLFLLQQILFFRELGFSLNDIQGFLSDPNFDKVETLVIHKTSLLKSLEKTKMLIKTIDKTVSHLKGEATMNTINLYDGFNEKMQTVVDEYTLEMRQQLVDNGLTKDDASIMELAEEKAKTWSPGDYAKHMLVVDEIFKEFVQLIEKNYVSDSPEAQLLVSKHYEWMKLLNGSISKKGYLILFIESGNSTKSSAYYTNYHPELMTYLLAAMKVFVDSEIL